MPDQEEDNATTVTTTTEAKRPQPPWLVGKGYKYHAEKLPFTYPVIELTPEDVAALSSYLRSNIDSRESLLRQCERMASIHVQGQVISFEASLLQRLKSRCPTNVPLGPWHKDRLIEMAHAYVGW